MLVAMAGLPGTGKSTVARAVVAALQQGNRAAVVLNKDTVRATLFPPETIEYSREQDDLCVDILLQVATFLLRRQPDTIVFLDGRTFSHHDQVTSIAEAAKAIPTDLHFIECTCDEATALARLRRDQREQRHPAQNRDAALYCRVRRCAEPLQVPHHLVVDTERTLEESTTRVLDYLRHATGAT
ncbi:MAG: ATP-binding protein [Anaerolineae bacterium]|nr:ATP-binding protein [Anaerolineae bacterium]